jgi:serine/threonine-protein kinase
MVHRDLKPANILTTGGVAKLCDFGLVTDKLVAGYASQQGYLEHLAPEVIVNARTSAKSDVWAMGLTIFRLLNGEPWYADVQAALGIDWTDRPAAIHRVKYLLAAGKFAARLPWMPHVPDSWRRFVRKAMSNQPAKRYHNGGAMLTALSTLALPEGPSWECTVSGGSIVWRRAKDTREDVAELKSAAPLYEYSAISQPLPGLTGRRLTHAASKKAVTRKVALAALQAFFATRTK